MGEIDNVEQFFKKEVKISFQIVTFGNNFCVNTLTQSVPSAPNVLGRLSQNLLLNYWGRKK